VLYLVVIGTILLCGGFSQLTVLFRGLDKQVRSSGAWAALQQHFILPALVGRRQLEPLPGKMGYMPGRGLGVFITIYVILNIVFSAVNFRSFQPNTWFLSAGFELCEYVGNRTGTLSLVNVSMAILFAGRNNLLIGITGWSQPVFLTLHRWTARVGTLQAVVHSICYTVAYYQDGYEGASAYAAKAAEAWFVRISDCFPLCV
jgi:hypothetical protein